MVNPPVLIPYPQELEILEGTYDISDGFILVDYEQPQSLLFTCNLLKTALSSLYHIDLAITASSAIPQGLLRVILRININHEIKPQGYILNINNDGIIIEALDPQGLFYGCNTFLQLIQFYNLQDIENKDKTSVYFPCIHINDWPDFINRGVMIDISRDKVPTMETTYNLVELLASWKINQLQLYTEHTFAYQRHPDVWKDASPFTSEEILLLDQYCRERYIELVPNQNSFGHLTHWLILPQYNKLAEAPDGFDFPWGHHTNPFSLCPIDDSSIKFLTSLYEELLPNFSSDQFNVGCDETFDLGQGRSKKACSQFGAGKIYLDFILKIYNEVRKRGHRMQFWGDIIVQHPELITEIPQDATVLEWGYEAHHPFSDHGKQFSRSGCKFYVCPGTSSWNSISGRTDNCIANLASAAINGKLNGAIGYLNTDWGDNGHWQTLPISYLGFMVGAAYAWSYKNNEHMDIKQALSLYVFADSTSYSGSIFYNLGNAYRIFGIEPDNSSGLFEILQRPVLELKYNFDISAYAKSLHQTEDYIQGIASEIHRFNTSRPDNDLLKKELSLTINLLRHSCLRGQYAIDPQTNSTSDLSKDLNDIISEYKAIWLLRNRRGGLNDSLKHFDIPLSDYQ